MDELRNFDVIFKNYYSEINLDSITIEEKEIEEFKKKFDEQGLSNVDEKKFKETILFNKIIDLRIDNLKKTKESLTKNKLNLFLDNKDIIELNLLFDSTIDSLSKVDVMDLSKEEIYKKFNDLQEKLDKKMLATSINYVTKLVDEVKKSNDYQTFESVKQIIDKANLPKEAVDVFKSLTADFGKPQVQNHEEKQLPVEQVRENTNDDNLVVDMDITEQQAIKNNEGSLENNNSQQQNESLEERINKIENNSTVKYGAEVNEQINEFNIDNENKRIEKLKELREKKGKLSIAEAIELRTLVEKRELRKEKELNNSVINKVGDVLLGNTNSKLERTIEKQRIAQDKYNVTKSFFSKKKLDRLNNKIEKLKTKKGSLTSFQINNAMFSRNLSEKLLTAHAVARNVGKKFVSVKDKVMSKFHSNPDIDIVLADAPVIINVPTYCFNSVNSRTL